MSELAIDRFEQKIIQGANGCINWAGTIRSNGYGTFYVNKKTASSHKWIYEFAIGKVPEGLTVDHLCRNKKCVNVDHLEVVTLTENILRGTSFSAINARKTHCSRGHELAGENLAITRRGTGKLFRQCRECHRLMHRIARIKAELGEK